MRFVVGVSASQASLGACLHGVEATLSKPILFRCRSSGRRGGEGFAMIAMSLFSRQLFFGGFRV